MDRCALTLMILVVASFFTITVFNNITDYHNTLLFIQHTLSMDTTKQNPIFMWRAITHPSVHHVAFISIILLQTIIAGLCWFSIFRLVKLKKSVRVGCAIQPAILGLTLAFLLYALGFIIIAGQWFMMRESTTWNVQASVQVFLIFIAAVLIFVKQHDDAN